MTLGRPEPVTGRTREMMREGSGRRVNGGFGDEAARPVRNARTVTCERTR